MFAGYNEHQEPPFSLSRHHTLTPIHTAHEGDTFFWLSGATVNIWLLGALCWSHHLRVSTYCWLPVTHGGGWINHYYCTLTSGSVAYIIYYIILYYILYKHSERVRYLSSNLTSNHHEINYCWKSAITSAWNCTFNSWFEPAFEGWHLGS